MPVDPLEEQLTELYLLEPEAFSAARAELAESVKAAGDEVGAARVRRLTKPTIAAYWTNQLARRWPEDLAGLLAVGPLLREATSRRDRRALLDLDRERRIKSDALLSLLWHFGEQEANQGRRRPSAESLTRVMETLTAAVMDDEVASQLRAGRLARPAVHDGFGPLDLLLAEGEAPTTETAARVTLLPVRPPDQVRDSQLQRSAADLVAAENRVAAATEHVESLLAMVASLDEEIAAISNDRDAAQERLDTWQRTLREAQRVASAARRRLDALDGE